MFRTKTGIEIPEATDYVDGVNGAIKILLDIVTKLAIEIDRLSDEQYTVALLTEQYKVMGQAVVITTMHDLPEGCYDNCPLCHDGYCLGLSVSDSGWPYQPAQEVRPYNCPLKIKETD